MEILQSVMASPSAPAVVDSFDEPKKTGLFRECKVVFENPGDEAEGVAFEQSDAKALVEHLRELTAASQQFVLAHGEGKILLDHSDLQLVKRCLAVSALALLNLPEFFEVDQDLEEDDTERSVLLDEGMVLEVQEVLSHIKFCQEELLQIVNKVDIEALGLRL